MCYNQMQNSALCFYISVQETTTYIVIYFICWLFDTLQYRSIHARMTHFLLLLSLKEYPSISSINVSSKLGHGLPEELQTVF